MDIAALSMHLSQQQVMTDFGTAMLSNSLDEAQVISGQITEMIDAASIERSVNPAVGGNIDLSV